MNESLPRASEVAESLEGVKGTNYSCITTVIAGLLVDVAMLRRSHFHDAQVMTHIRVLLEGLRVITDACDIRKEDVATVAEAIRRDANDLTQRRGK